MDNVEKNTNALDNFLNDSSKRKAKNAKKMILSDREGLIERVDKVFVTKDGKQLLREQY